MEENHFRTCLEEIVLAIQSNVQRVIFQHNIHKGNIKYALAMVNYYQGRIDQANQDYIISTALYDNAIAQTNIGVMGRE